MDLSWLRSRLDQIGDEGMRQKAAAIDSGLSEAMNLKRGVVDRLRPALLDHFGLATALQAHCEDVCRRAGVPCDVQVAEEISAMPPGSGARALPCIGVRVADGSCASRRRSTWS